MADIVDSTFEIDSLIFRLGGKVYVARSKGFCGFECLSDAFNALFKSLDEDDWSAGDVRSN